MSFLLLRLLLLQQLLLRLLLLRLLLQLRQLLLLRLLLLRLLLLHLLLHANVLLHEVLLLLLGGEGLRKRPISSTCRGQHLLVLLLLMKLLLLQLHLILLLLLQLLQLLLLMLLLLLLLLLLELHQRLLIGRPVMLQWQRRRSREYVLHVCRPQCKLLLQRRSCLSATLGSNPRLRHVQASACFLQLGF